MQVVRSYLLGVAWDEPQTELRVIPGQKHSISVHDGFSAEHAGPELRQTRWVARVEGHGQQSRGHHGTLDEGQQGGQPTSAGQPSSYSP